MDTKALAKSKRAHSQHHSKKHHPNVKSKAPSVGASSGKIPSGQQVTEKPHQPHGSSKLPSNWDRYEEEYDSGSENPSHNNMSQATDVVMPKSKGADYGHLISEAKSQSLTDISSEGFPSFDDVLTGKSLVLVILCLYQLYHFFYFLFGVKELWWSRSYGGQGGKLEGVLDFVEMCITTRRMK